MSEDQLPPLPSKQSESQAPPPLPSKHIETPHPPSLPSKPLKSRPPSLPSKDHHTLPPLPSKQNESQLTPSLPLLPSKHNENQPPLPSKQSESQAPPPLPSKHIETPHPPSLPSKPSESRPPSLPSKDHHTLPPLPSKQNESQLIPSLDSKDHNSLPLLPSKHNENQPPPLPFGRDEKKQQLEKEEKELEEKLKREKEEKEREENLRRAREKRDMEEKERREKEEKEKEEKELEEKLKREKEEKEREENLRKAREKRDMEEKLRREKEEKEKAENKEFSKRKILPPLPPSSVTSTQQPTPPVVPPRTRSNSNPEGQKLSEESEQQQSQKHPPLPPLPSKSATNEANPPPLPPQNPPPSPRRRSSSNPQRPKNETPISIKGIERGWATPKPQESYVETGEKSAMLLIQEGGLFPHYEKRWFVIKGNQLLWYKFPDDAKPMKRILFEDITLVEDAPYLHKPFSFHIEVSGKQHHYLRGESFAEQRDWISELSKRSPNMKKLPEGMNSLSNYKHYSLNPNTQIPPSNPVKKEPNSLLNDPFVLPSQSPSNSSLSSGSGRKEDSDENMKKYHEYKDKKKNKEKNKIRLVYVYGDNEEKKVDLTAAACSMKITKYETKNEGKKDMYTSYTIEVTFQAAGRTQTWTIFRRFNQFYDLASALKNGNIIIQMNLPSKTTSRNFHPEFIQDRIQISNVWLQEVCSAMSEIVTHEAALYGFAKFAAPVQYGDIKPNGFEMPFPL